MSLCKSIFKILSNFSLKKCNKKIYITKILSFYNIKKFFKLLLLIFKKIFYLQKKLRKIYFQFVQNPIFYTYNFLY